MRSLVLMRAAVLNRAFSWDTDPRANCRKNAEYRVQKSELLVHEVRETDAVFAQLVDCGRDGPRDHAVRQVEELIHLRPSRLSLRDFWTAYETDIETDMPIRQYPGENETEQE